MNNKGGSLLLAAPIPPDVPRPLLSSVLGVMGYGMATLVAANEGKGKLKRGDKTKPSITE